MPLVSVRLEPVIGTILPNDASIIFFQYRLFCDDPTVLVTQNKLSFAAAVLLCPVGGNGMNSCLPFGHYFIVRLVGSNQLGTRNLIIMHIDNLC